MDYINTHLDKVDEAIGAMTVGASAGLGLLMLVRTYIQLKMQASQREKDKLDASAHEILKKHRDKIQRDFQKEYPDAQRVDIGKWLVAKLQKFRKKYKYYPTDSRRDLDNFLDLSVDISL